MKKINYLGFLSLLSLIAILGFQNKNTGLYGFFGFVYFIRYFWIIPDELFLLNVQKSSTIAFMSGMISLIPSMFICALLYNVSAAIPTAFAMCFVVSALAFTISMMIVEYKEQKGAQE